MIWQDPVRIRNISMRIKLNALNWIEDSVILILILYFSHFDVKLISSNSCRIVCYWFWWVWHFYHAMNGDVWLLAAKYSNPFNSNINGCENVCLAVTKKEKRSTIFGRKGVSFNEFLFSFSLAYSISRLVRIQWIRKRSLVQMKSENKKKMNQQLIASRMLDTIRCNAKEE